MTSCKLKALIICVALGTVAHGDVHSWNNSWGDWSDAGSWSPMALPAGGDTVSLGNTLAAENSWVTLDMNDSVAGVSITDGMGLRTDGSVLTVTGDTTISGRNDTGVVVWPSQIIVDRGVGADDYDTDNLSVTNQGRVDMRGGILEIDEVFTVGSTAGVSGDGVIDFEGNNSRVLILDGFLGAGVEGLTMNQNGTGLIDLDGNFAQGRINVTGSMVDGSAHDWLTINGTELADSYSAEMWIGSDNVVTMNLANGWIADSNSTISFLGQQIDGPGSLLGGDVTLAGTVEVYHDAEISAHATFASTATIDFGTNDDLKLIGGSEWQGASFTGALSGSSITPQGTIDVTNTTTVDLPMGVVDLDGDIGTTVFNIGSGHELALNVSAVENDGDGFDGQINVGDGATLSINMPTNWTNEGVIDLFHGTVAGAGIDNQGSIQGAGTLDVGQLNNDGTVTASNGGTLVIESNGGSDLDGVGGNGTWVAVSGNIVINGEPANVPFSGEVSVAAARSFTMTEGGLDNSGNINLSGRYEGNLIQAGTLTASGVIGLATIAADDATFANGGTNTLNDSLSLEGNFVAEAGAVFTGPANLVNLSGSELILNDAAALDVAVVNQGTLGIGDTGQATVDAFSQTDTGSFAVEILGDALSDHDQLVVLGSADLAGEIAVSLLSGETFDLYETAEVVLAPGGINGIFETVAGSVLSPSEGLAVTYEATTVDVTRALMGDANLDGNVDGQDFVIWSDHKFMAGSTWETGDFNGDGVTNGQDFVLWNNNKFTMVDQAAMSQVMAVPESRSFLGLLALSFVGLVVRHHRTTY